MAVDTLKLYERFSKAGMAAAAAKEVAEAIKESNDELALGLATKQDIDLKVEILRKEIAALSTATNENIASLSAISNENIASLSAATNEKFASLTAITNENIASLSAATKVDIANLKAEIGHLEIRLIKWMIGVGIGGFTALLGLLKILTVI